MEKTTLYVRISCDQWQQMKHHGILLHKDYCDAAHEWFAREVAKRSIVPWGGIYHLSWSCSFHPWTKELTYCFLEKHKWLKYGPEHMILKIQVNSDMVVPFIDDGYVRIVTDTNTGKPSFLSWKNTEYDETAGASDEECQASYSRVFDVSKRSNIRAFLPFVTRDMVKKVWVYRHGKRLRKRHQYKVQCIQ